MKIGREKKRGCFSEYLAVEQIKNVHFKVMNSILCRECCFSMCNNQCLKYM